MPNILAIDDDVQILSIIKKALTKDGHNVTTVSSADDVDQSRLSGYDMILLDVMMPGTDGFSFCGAIRKKVDCPILFLTAKVMEADLVEGFMSGGDDYIKKPFAIGELRARVLAHLRRENRQYHNRLCAGAFVFDVSQKQISVHDRPLYLTKSQYEICELLVRNKGQVFSLEQILESIYGYDSDSDSSAIREHIKNIRGKFSAVGENPIQTVWGIGYKWE